MTANNCKACLYYLGHDLGSCRRYPTYQTRSQNEWCGEFAEKAILPPVVGGVFSLMGLPVVDIPQISKPRGRPRKND
jgi:hypothetical protein